MHSFGKQNVAFNHWWNTAGWLDKTFKSMDFGLISFEDPDAVYTQRKHNMAPGWKLEERHQEEKLLQGECGRRRKRRGEDRLFPCDTSENAIYGKYVHTSPKLESLQRKLVLECKARNGCKSTALL